MEAFETAVEDGIIHAIGWLAIFNPSFPDRFFKLDLSIYEDRQMAQMLLYLAVAEDGENWQDEHWRFRLGELEKEPFAGWELPLSWTEEMKTHPRLIQRVFHLQDVYACNIILVQIKDVNLIGKQGLVYKNVV